MKGPRPCDLTQPIGTGSLLISCPSPGSTAPKSAFSAAAATGHARVYIFQPAIQHYRIPVWDAIIERAAGRYELTAIGPLDHGEAFGGGLRPYLRDMPEVELRVPGCSLLKWPYAVRAVLRERPEVVILPGNPRNLTCWKLPAVCQRIGAAVVAHSKVHSLSGRTTLIMQALKRRFYKRFDFAVCYGERSREELLSLGFPPHCAQVAQNTIDTRRVFTQGDGIDARARELRATVGLTQKSILLCIGRMEPEKRHGDLLTAWPRLREIDPNLVMVLVGGGPLLQAVRERAREIDPERIIVTGRVAEGDDYAWIAASDLTVYPGAVGLAINQSLALGRATIIADEYGADAEIIQHGVTGWRYSKGDLDALVTTIAQVVKDVAARRRVVENGRTLMREQATIENMADVFHATILDAINLSRRRMTLMNSPRNADERR